MEVLSSNPVVIDNGSGILKAGFAGNETPSAVFPSYIGHVKHTRVMAGALDGDVFLGRKAQDLRGLLRLQYPMQHGIVEDWEGMEAIWRHTYFNELKVSPESQAVLLTEAPLNPNRHREKAAEIFFETFNVPALFISIQAVLSLYASGRTTGVVLDSGDGVTHAVPVFEGFALSNGIRSIDIAGRDVTSYLELLFRKAGYNFSTSAERDIIRSVKEKLCYVALNPAREEREDKLESFTLPDGSTIKLSSERYRAPEILFNPDIVSDESPGIPQLIYESIMKSDIDLRKHLYANIILSGGSTLYKGFGDRLLHEMKKLAPKDTKIKIYAPPERKYSTWIGGSILASLSTFKKMWISASEYQEDPNIVHRKVF